jgi:transcriptional regulator with XRE-family HTH domain
MGGGKLMAETCPTGLAKWLKLNRVTECQLAREIGVTPTAIGNLARGRTTSINKKILDAVSRRTLLAYDAIIKPIEEIESPAATGDHRIDLCLAIIGKYLHTPEMCDKCRRYISPDFLCCGRTYDDDGNSPVGWDQMCALNAMPHFRQITSILLTTSWYTPHGIAPQESRVLHSHWRGLTADLDHSPRYHSTFIVFEFEQAIREMSPICIPKIKSWWSDETMANAIEDNRAHGVLR